MSRFDLVIVLICATFAILYYRNFLNAGKLHFGEALVIGQSVNFIGSLISTVVIYVFIAFVDTKVISRHVSDLQSLLVSGRQQMEEDLRGEAFENILRNVLATTPSDVALDLFIKKFFVCLVLIGIIGAFLRKI